MNEVKVVITGQNRSGSAIATAKKDIAELTKLAATLQKSVAKMNDELAEGFSKRGGTNAVEQSLKRLEKSADESFGRVKAKMEAAFEAAGEERIVKIKAEFDKNRLTDSLSGFNFDVDISKGIGPKIATAFSKGVDAVGKGIDLAGAGVKGAVSFAGGLSDGLRAQHPAVRAAVYGTMATAVAAAAPLAGGALAGGIIAGFGAGIGGLGILAAAQNAKVRESFSDMWAGVVADTRARATVIEDVLLRTASRAQTAWNETGHVLAGAFSRVAPGLESLLDGLLRSFQRFAPALEPMASAASAVFKDLGDRLPGIIGEIADSFTSLASSVEKNPKALGDFLASIGEIVEFGAGFLGFLNDVHEGNKRILDTLSKPFEWAGLKETGDEVGKAGKSMLEMAKIPTGPMRSIEEAIAAIGETAEGSAARVDAVRTALDRMNGNTPAYTDGLAAAAEAASALDGTFKTAEDRAQGFGQALLDQSGAFDVTNKKGRELYDNVQNASTGFGDMAAAVAAGQVSREQFIGDAGRMRDRLNETWRQAGLTEAQIVALNEKYSLTPDQLLTMVRLSGADAAEARLAWLARDRVAYISTQVRDYGGYLGTGMNGQQIFHDRSRAHGGASGGWTTVGEHGPERVKLPGGSVVYPNTSSPHLLAQQDMGSTTTATRTDALLEQLLAAVLMLKTSSMGQADPVQVNLMLDGKVLAKEIVSPLKGAVRARGGEPSVFG